MQIDFEVKAFVVSVIFAAIKFFAVSSDNEIHVLGIRAIFGVVHLYFLTLFIRANIAIADGLGSKESKNTARNSLRQLFGSIAMRAVIIAFVHVKTGMLPPLLVSTTMAVMSVMENEQCESIMIRKKTQ